MSQLWRPVLAKLSIALRLWNAKDKTAHVMLSPWKKILHPAMLEEFLRGTILPKLHEALKSYQINPAQQDPGVWGAVLLWHDMFQPETFVVFLLNTVRSLLLLPPPPSFFLLFPPFSSFFFLSLPFSSFFLLLLPPLSAHLLPPSVLSQVAFYIIQLAVQ
jgi:hypothetical protein